MPLKQMYVKMCMVSRNVQSKCVRSRLVQSSCPNYRFTCALFLRVFYIRARTAFRTFFAKKIPMRL